LINLHASEHSSEQPELNKLIRAQLQVVEDNLNCYLHHDGLNGLENPTRMPHEWGSLDSLDDMRNSLYTAHYLLEMLTGSIVESLTGEASSPLDHLRDPDNFREIFAPCTTSPVVYEVLGLNEEEV